MQTPGFLESDITYLKHLVGAGIDGIASARHELHDDTPLSGSQTAVWTPTAIGAAIGILSTRYLGSHKSVSGVVIGGAVGTTLGLGVALAWASRRLARAAARAAMRRVNSVRDAHWLEAHPINYA